MCLDHATLALITLTLAYSVLAFGCAEGSSQFVLALLIGLLTLLMAGRWLWDGEFKIVPTAPWLPIGLIVLLAIAQLVPLPRSAVEFLSPARVAASTGVLDSDNVPQTLPLSVAASETRHALRLALLAGLMLIAVTSYVRRMEHVQYLLTSLFGLGVLQAAIALAQIATGADRLYWNFDPGQSGMMNAGSFVNHSHFAQFVNLSIGAGTGLLLLKFGRNDHQRGLSRSSPRTSIYQLIRFQGWILAGLAVSMFAVCLSLSRSGILSLLVALTVTGCQLARQQHLGWKGWAFSIIPAIVFVLLLFFGLDLFYERLATLEQGTPFRDRWALTTATCEAGSHYLVLGSGLGTYAYVFPAFDNTGSASVAVYADNDYAQLFVEGGMTGVAILLLTLGSMAWSFSKCLRSRASSIAQVAHGLMVGFLAVAIHSMTDFGQRLPGVFLMTITLLGLLSVLPATIRRGHQGNLDAPLHHRPRGIAGWLGRMGAIGVVVVVLVWVTDGAYACYQAETWWATALQREHRLRELEWNGTDQEYRELLVAAENRVVWQPDDPMALHRLNFYRWMAINRSEFMRGGGGKPAGPLREVIEQIVTELAKVRRLAPSCHSPYLLEGKIRAYVLGETREGGKLIARATELAIGDSHIQFAYGEWNAYFGNHEIARAYFHRAIEIDPDYFAPVSRLLIQNFGDVATTLDWANDDLDRLRDVANLLESRPEYTEDLAEIRFRKVRVLESLAKLGQASPDQLMALGENAAKHQDHRRAIAHYRQALARQYHLVPARLGLARSLQAIGRCDEAMNEVRICLRRDPSNVRALELAEELALLVDNAEERGRGKTQKGPLRAGR